MNKVYKVFIDHRQIGTTMLERADAAMGVVSGRIRFIDIPEPFEFLKSYCETNGIYFEIYPDDRIISTRTIPSLKVIDDKDVEIKGLGYQISGMDSDSFELAIEGIAHPFFGEEFPHHVKGYEDRLEQIDPVVKSPMKRIVKYLIYALGLPSIGFISMFILRPITAGAHDGGFLGMVFGLTLGQIVFACWLINKKWYYGMLLGVVIAFATISVAFWTIWKLGDLYNPVKDGYFREPNEDLGIILQWIFFFILILTSIMIFETVNRLSKDNK